jgi:hypothetical protein
VTWRRILTHPPILVKTGSAGFLLEWQNVAVDAAIASQKKFKKKSKKALTLGFARISSSVPTATSVSELGMFFAGLPRVLEQVRGGVVIPKMSLRQATATWVGSPLPQPPETIFDSAGPVSHKQ